MSNKILSKFISRAIEEVYMKYTNIPKDEEDLVSSFVEKIDHHKVEFDPYQDYDHTKGLAEVLKHENNADIIKLYLVLASDLTLKLDLEEVRNLYHRLESKGYSQVGQYIFFYDYGEDLLKASAEAILEDNLVRDGYS